MEALNPALPTARPKPGRSLHRFANPGQFLRLSGRVLPWLVASAAVVTLAGLVWGLFLSPADWQQGDAVRIMYVHVPAAWLASLGYGSLAICGLLSIVWRHPLADLAAMGDRAGRRRFHRRLPHHRQPLGQAHVGRLVGVGCAADLGARAVLPLSRADRAHSCLRQSGARLPRPPPSWRWWAR